MFRSVNNNYGDTGIIDDVEEINSYNFYNSKIKAILNNKPNGQSESKLAKEGYGHLRAAIEVTVEDQLFEKYNQKISKRRCFSIFIEN